MYGTTRPQVTPAEALDRLERNIGNPRPVGPDTLHRREKAAYRMVRRLESAIALVPNGDEHHATFMHLSRLLGRAYALHGVAVNRCHAAYEAALAERHEAEELGAALQMERINHLLYGDEMAV